MAQTRTADLVVPEIWADAIQAKFPGRLVLANLGFTDSSLEGSPGDTINFTEWAALTDADDLAEETAMVPERMTQSPDSAVVKEVGKAVEITDQALLTAVGAPMSEAQRQVMMTVTRKIDADLSTAIHAAIPDTHDNYVSSTGDLTAALVVEAVAVFGDDYEPDGYVLVIHSAQRAQLYSDAQFIDASQYGTQGVLVNGEIGRLYGMPVIVSNRATTAPSATNHTALILRRGSAPSQDRDGYGPAFGTIWKRRPMVERDRDILARSTVVTTNVHYAVKVLDESGLAVIETGAAA